MSSRSRQTRNLRDGTLVINDGVAETITVALEEGNLSWGITKNIKNILDRGDLSHMRQGDEAPVTGKMTLKFNEFISSSSTSGTGTASAEDPTPYEAFTRTGNAAAWVSTNDDNGDVHTVEMVFTIDDPNAAIDETVTFAKVSIMSIEFGEGDEYDTLVIEFQDFETAPTIAKAAA